MSVKPSSLGEYDDAHVVYKRVKRGVCDFAELSPREVGLLYIWFPEILPDVEEGMRR